ncbi:MAG: hypothetical protein AAF517_20540 [Planctomycetota bacterium]
MNLYVYETPAGGHVADFRAYLDGHDHAFEDHRPLRPEDPRWEKIHAIRDPMTQRELRGSLHYVGKSDVEWKELMQFPIQWSDDYEPEEWASVEPAE